MYFPGWDNYVQYYYDATKTLINVKQEIETNNGILVPGSYDYPLLSYEKLPDLIGPQAEPAQKNRKLHLTSFINKLLNYNIKIKCQVTKEPWYEFDDYQDYLNFRKSNLMKP